MLKSSARSVIRLRGVRHNNLKNFDLDLPLNQLIVVTGLSGSGKSSLAFDTLFAEGQRRYIETFSPYARQFFDRMDKPQVDSIEGIPPAIAIEQRNAVRTTRSTVGTMTEICDYMKLLWPHIAQLHCRQCGRPVRKDSPKEIWQTLNDECRMTNGVPAMSPKEVWVTFDLPLSDRLSLEESLGLISRQGYQRLVIDDEIVQLDEIAARIRHSSFVIRHFTVLQDRLKLSTANRARFIEACEQAYHFGKGKLAVRSTDLEPRSTPHASTLQPFNPSTPRHFSNRLHCAECDLEYREPSSALFSFNHPLGACPACKGFGRNISIDYDLALPDRSKTLAEGAVKPWQTGHGVESQRDLMKFCRACDIPTDVSFAKLPEKTQNWVINGDKDYGIDEEHEWPRAWYGVKGYFRWLESKAYKMHVRVLLSRYRAYTTCPDCNGARLQPEALLYRFTTDDLRFTSAEGSDRGASIVNHKSQITLADFYALPIRDALALVEALANSRNTPHAIRHSDPIALALSEVRSRLGYLSEVGLGYLTLDRPTRTLSGGETERVNLTTCLGTRLVNTLFVLDEPSVGLHPRDTDRLVHVLQQLRQAGNTVVVVEHEPSVMRAAEQIVDLGPGHGATGGRVVFQGTFREILKAKESLTGQYLSGEKRIEIPERRAVGQASSRSDSSDRRSRAPAADALHEAVVPFGDRLEACPTLRLAHATRHNLKDVIVEIPLGRFVCVTGVSGSGKTTLIREVLLPALEANLKCEISNVKSAPAKASDRIGEPPSLRPEAKPDGENGDEKLETRNSKSGALLTGHEHLSRVVLVDQSILGKTPRSNPAVYIGAFDDIREFFAQSEVAKQRGLGASAFSFNSSQGQCERCRGAGFEKIEMQFLSDVFIRCPDCNGRRYRQHILEVRVSSQLSVVSSRTRKRSRATDHRPLTTVHSWSIADLLDATVDEAIDFLATFADSKPAQRAVTSLKLLQEVGLGYLRLGQPINTLSGGESQRLKLVRHLAESVAAVCDRRNTGQDNNGGHRPPLQERTLFLFDEPTTGLHFDDVRALLAVFQRLVAAGHSVIVIEHNLDVIKCADWVIDLGPDAGDQGGQIVAQGTPEQVADCEASHTGRSLREVLRSRREKEKRSGEEKERSSRRPPFPFFSFSPTRAVERKS